MYLRTICIWLLLGRTFSLCLLDQVGLLCCSGSPFCVVLLIIESGVLKSSAIVIELFLLSFFSPLVDISQWSFIRYVNVYIADPLMTQGLGMLSPHTEICIQFLTFLKFTNRLPLEVLLIM